MAKVQAPLKLEPETLGWIDEYVKSRGVTRQVWLESAVSSYVEECLRGVPEFSAAVRRQLYARGEELGVGDCPRRGEGLGHVWRSPREDPVRPCRFCGLAGRGPGGHFEQVVAERSDVFSRLVVPMESGTGSEGKAHPKGLTPEQQVRAKAVVADKRRRDREAVDAGVARPGQVAGVKAAGKREVS
jgi:hypothetical protein